MGDILLLPKFLKFRFYKSTKVFYTMRLKRMSMKRGYLIISITLVFSSPLWADYMTDLQKGNYGGAFVELTQLARKGDANAYSILGLMNARGMGIPYNYFEEDVKTNTKMAGREHAKAWNLLGFMYSNGKGVSENYNEAAKWFRKAAGLGDALAQYNLGILYYQGHGVPQDYGAAAKWYKKAAEQGHGQARYNLRLMYLQKLVSQ